MRRFSLYKKPFFERRGARECVTFTPSLALSRSVYPSYAHSFSRLWRQLPPGGSLWYGSVLSFALSRSVYPSYAHSFSRLWRQLPPGGSLWYGAFSACVFCFLLFDSHICNHVAITRVLVIKKSRLRG